MDSSIVLQYILCIGRMNMEEKWSHCMVESVANLCILNKSVLK